MSMAFLITIRVNPAKIANNSVTKSWIVVLWSTRRSQSSRRLTKTTTTTYRTTVLLSPKGEFSWAAEAQQLKIEGSIESPTRLLQPNKKFWKIFVFRNWIFCDPYIAIGLILLLKRSTIQKIQQKPWANGKITSTKPSLLNKQNDTTVSYFLIFVLKFIFTNIKSKCRILFRKKCLKGGFVSHFLR